MFPRWAPPRDGVCHSAGAAADRPRRLHKGVTVDQGPDMAALLEQVNTPEELGSLLDVVNDDEVAAVVRDVGADQVLSRVFAAFPERFDPVRAGEGAQATVQWTVGFDGTDHRWVVEIADGSCSTAPDSVESARLTLSLALPDFLRLVSGRLNATQAFMTGKLALQGDVMFALQMQSWFGLA